MGVTIRVDKDSKASLLLIIVPPENSTAPSHVLTAASVWLSEVCSNVCTKAPCGFVFIYMHVCVQRHIHAISTAIQMRNAQRFPPAVDFTQFL